MSGKSTNGRRALQKALDTLQPGDTLIVTKLDRLARSIRDLLNLLDEIKAAGAHIRSLDDPWLDTSSAHGELILQIMGSLYEFERKLIRSRCDEGIRRAKARGAVFGRKPVLDHGEKRKIAQRYAAGETIAELAREYSCGVAVTFIRRVETVSKKVSSTAWSDPQNPQNPHQPFWGSATVISVYLLPWARLPFTSSMRIPLWIRPHTDVSQLPIIFVLMMSPRGVPA
jgi:DNA invertase Pin-like site-specific DNA recombinase